MKIEARVTFIGAGNMGEAMLKGLLNAGVPARNLKIMELFKARSQYIQKTYKVKKAQNMADALTAEAVVVAVKPKEVDNVVRLIAESKRPPPLIISIAAGVPLSNFLDKLGPGARVIRVMPNTPALVGASVSAYYAGPGVRGEDLTLTETILNAIGACHHLMDESLLDAVTGLSGSGPAYVFVVIEALADAGVKLGLSRELSLSLAAHTVAGAGKMAAVSGEHPALLKDKVASPAGTTIEGLAELERAGFRAALINAVEAAAMRARELGNK